MAFGIERLQRRCSSTQYRPEIDGLRFFAIAIVILGHVAERMHRFLLDAGRSGPDDSLFWPFSKPGDGVLLFFAISGFIITCQFLRDGTLSRNYIQKYFRRRVLRIEPPYFVILTLTYIVVGILGFVPADVRRFWGAPQSLHVSFVASLFYAHDLIFGTMPRLFSPGWSLEIEVQFYILAPVLFALYFLSRRRPLRALFGLGILALAVAAAFWPLSPGVNLHFGRSLLRFFAFFWIGVLFADFQGEARRIPKWAASLLGWTGAAMLCLDGTTVHFQPFSGLQFFIEATAIFLMFASVLKEGSSLRRFCSLPTVSVVGGACYSIYLTHLQVAQLFCKATFRIFHALPDWAVLATGLALGASVITVVGLLFYVAIERPCMNPHWPSLLWSKLTGKARVAPDSKAVEPVRKHSLEPEPMPETEPVP